MTEETFTFSKCNNGLTHASSSQDAPVSSDGQEICFKNEIPSRHYEAWAVSKDKALHAAGLPCPLPRSFGPISLPWGERFPPAPVGMGAALGWEA